MLDIALIFTTIWVWKNGWGARALLPAIPVVFMFIHVCTLAASPPQGLSGSEASMLASGPLFVVLLFCLAISIVMCFVKPKQSTAEHLKCEPLSPKSSTETDLPAMDPQHILTKEQQLAIRAKIAAQYRRKLDAEYESQQSQDSTPTLH